MNVARQLGSVARRRTYATIYVPPASLPAVHRRAPPGKPIPDSPNFYTARSAYFDQINQLESAITHTRGVLQNLELLPLPKFALDALPPLQHVWMTKDRLSEALNTRLTTSRYRRLLGLLSQLGNYRRIADVAGCETLASHIGNVLDIFERENKEAFLARGRRKPVQFDEHGRSYTVGRRKESAARVWVVPVQGVSKAASASAMITAAPPPAQQVDGLTAESSASEVLLPLSLAASSPAPVKVSTTQILINNTPVSQYFPVPADRERVVRPFKIAGLVGAFNVFALVRGGGTTGQSGAVSLGIAKGLAAHVPDVEPLLRRAKLMRRDPRMVERKKTGRAKAREAYGWVKR
ncbi:SSU ribosomal protein S9P [Amylocystis lapponica]|nr:SSU ribosomal protein S9P [Amylocystis lapponica]